MLMFFNMFFLSSPKSDPVPARPQIFGLDSLNRDLLVAFLLHDALNGTEVSQRSRTAAVA